MASSKLILREEEVAMREAGAKAATLTREARARVTNKANISCEQTNVIFTYASEFDLLDKTSQPFLLR